MLAMVILCHYVDRLSSWKGSFYFHVVLNILLHLFVQENILLDLVYRKLTINWIELQKKSEALLSR